MKFSTDRWQRLAGISVSEGEEKVKSKNSLSETVKGLAVGLIEDGQERIIVLYDPNEMKKALSREEDEVLTSMAEAIQGMIRIAPPVYGSGSKDSCLGAWEVTRSAVKQKGKGIGGLLYSLAAAESPRHKIMSDRQDVSSDAVEMWKSISKKASTKEELDDEENPKTEDPNDDCKLHSYDEDVGPASNLLNFAYGIKTDFDVRKLDKAHEDFLDEISWSLPKNVDVQILFVKAAKIAFEKEY